MEPLKIIVSALAKAAAAVRKETVSQSVKDSYTAFKGLIISKLRARADIENALKQCEQRPDSEHRQGVLEEELDSAQADKVSELVDMAIEILDLLKREGLCSNISYSARQTGDGSIVQGTKNTGVGKEGQAVIDSKVKGDVLGPGAKKEEIHIHTAANDRGPCPNDSSLLKSYLYRLQEETRWMNLSGIDPSTAAKAEGKSLLLDSIYTELDTLEMEMPQGEEMGLKTHLDKGYKSRRVPIVKIMDRECLLVLLGDPGSGKSTFINFVTLCLAGERLESKEINLNNLGKEWTQGWILPVKVVLRDFVARGLPQIGEKASGDHLLRFIKEELGETLKDFAPLLHTHLLDHGGIVLLDGFDEVPEADKRREQVMGAVRGFASDFPLCRFLLTSRTYCWQRQHWKLPGFNEAVLAPFNDIQIETFIDRWYAHICLQRQGEMCPEDARGRATLLKYAIKHKPGLDELARRPLLLTLMAGLHAWRQGELPEKREELYNATLDLLLNIWEQPKIVRDCNGKMVVVQPAAQEWLRAPRNQILKALEELGFASHAKQSGLEGTADIQEDKVVQALWRIRENPDLRRERIVEYIRDRAGLLIPRGVGVYTFPHKTFQEYLAARYLTEEDWPVTISELVLNEPEKWREVALLAAAKAARGSSYAVWGLVESLVPSMPGEQPDPCEGWAAFIAVAILLDNKLLENLSRPNKEKVTRLQHWLVGILKKALLPPVERAAAGKILASFGDLRFREDAWFLPDDPLLGFIEIPEGPFVMGEGEEEHEIDLPKYLIARYPVTVAQFKAFTDDSGYHPKDTDSLKGELNHPVTYVTWNDAMAYCYWLTEKLKAWDKTPYTLLKLLRHGDKEGRKCRITLPSEAEWEKGARGTDGRKYPWGDEKDPNRANYDKTGIGATSTLGCFPGGASPYGVEDMSGNVWEWTRSMWGETLSKPDFGYPYNPEDGREDVNAPDKILRVVRGGSYKDSERRVCCAVRSWYYPNYRYWFNGFRIVASPITSEL